MRFTEDIVALVRQLDYASLPAEAVETVKVSVMDTLGVALAGWGEPEAQAVVRHVTEWAQPGESSILGSHSRLSPIAAATVNGTLAHVLDFDDTAWTYIGHPGAVLMPVILALGEPARASGAEIIAAYVAGFEVMAAIGAPVVDAFARRGLHLTSAVGVFGATAAAAKLLGLDDRQLATALGIAASHASGLKANFGTGTKALHAGMAARDGVEAALLARSGLSANPAALEDSFGFFRALAGTKPPDRLGDGLAIVRDGIAVKRYPCCTGSHPVIDGILDLAEVHGIRAADVAAVRCGITPEVLGELLYPIPASGHEARFSINFAVAVAIRDRSVGLQHFTDEQVRDPLIRSLMERCETYVDETLDRPNEVRAPRARIRVELVNGEAFEERIDLARGNPGNPLSIGDLEGKFDACAQLRFPDIGRVRELRSALQGLEEISDVRSVVALASSTS